MRRSFFSPVKTISKGAMRPRLTRQFSAPVSPQPPVPTSHRASLRTGSIALYPRASSCLRNAAREIFDLTPLCGMAATRAAAAAKTRSPRRHSRKRAITGVQSPIRRIHARLRILQGGFLKDRSDPRRVQGDEAREVSDGRVDHTVRDCVSACSRYGSSDVRRTSWSIS